MKVFKFILIFLFIINCFLNMVAWVDESTIDVYTGTIASGQFAGYQCKYYLNDYYGIARSGGGYLISTDHSKQGKLLINSFETEFTLSPDQPAKMMLNGSWVDFEIVPDQMPAAMPFPVFIGMFAVLLILAIILLMFIGRGVLL